MFTVCLWGVIESCGVACVLQELEEEVRKSGVDERGLRLKYNKLSYMGRTTGYLYLISVSHGVAAYDNIVR